jgi:hypothetical protein
MTEIEMVKPQIMPARVKRKRTWMTVLVYKTDDCLSCLRGPVNGGAEKEKNLDLPEKQATHFIKFIWNHPNCIASIIN